MVVVIKKSASKKEIKKALQDLSKSKSKKGIDISKYCGKVNFNEDGLTLQKKWRDEWE